MAATTTAPPPSPESKLNPKTLRKSIKALLKWPDSQPTPNSDQFLYLVLTLTTKTPPPKPTRRRHVTKPIHLPHPFLPPSATFTLIYDDRRRNYTLTHDVIQSRIATHNLPITETLKLSKLKSHLASFETRRALMDSCDCFLVDDRIVAERLPEAFYKKRRRAPVAVDLSKKDWRGEVERVRRSAIVAGLGSGSCSVVRVARVEMEAEEIAENVVKAVEGIVGIVPKKWRGVRAVHLKLLESLALPLYEAVKDGNVAV